MLFRMVRTLLLAYAAIGLSACDNDNGADTRSLADIQASGELRVLTRNAPTSYYIGRNNQPSGPEYDLVSAFAETLDVEPVFIVKDTLGQILEALARGRADMAAAGLTITEGREKRFLFSKPTLSVSQQVVCRRGGNVARKLSQLSEVSLEVIADSSYEARLRELQQQFPDLEWVSNESVGTEPLLHKVWKKQIDCTIADSNIVDVNRRYMPELIVMFDISDTQQLAWALPKGAAALSEAANDWLRSDHGNAALAAVDYRYYSFIDKFDFVDTRALIRRIEKRLPAYDRLFNKAAEQHDVDDVLLAAQAYQESHWNPNAKSPTGVRGIMMLTRTTAKALGVENRLDPEQAIPAGARYLSKMRERFNENIPEPDRTFMALAAYNVGRAHMHDAQTLARQLGKDPHSWADIREVLPLLSDKRYYKDLRYGYARGLEPVRYVRRIRNYQDILEAKTDGDLPLQASGE